MPRNEESILIIAYKFPPAGRIGAKRMAKFAKYLARAGWTVHVATVRTGLRDVDSWTDDVQDARIVMHRLSPCYPRDFLDRRHAYTVKGVGLKLLQHALRQVAPFLYGIDEASRWDRVLLPYAADLIGREGIPNLLSTGAPFTANHHAIRLHARCPGTRLITDFRDPWTRQDMYPLPTEALRRRARRLERDIVNHGHTVTATTAGIARQLRDVCENPATRFEVVTNGYDPDERVLWSVGAGPRPFRMVHAGSFTNDGAVAVRSFAQGVAEALRREPGMERDLEVRFYGFPFAHLLDADLRRRLEKVFGYGGTISAESVLREMREAFLVPILRGPSCTDVISSKMFDAINMRRPVFCLMPPGEATDLVRRHGWGTRCPCDDPEAVTRELTSWYRRWQARPGEELELRPEDVEPFSYERLANRIVQLFGEAAERRTDSSASPTRVQV